MSSPVLEKLAKWRTVFASWQLGTRTDTDAELQAVKDHREATIMLRAEFSALVGLLVAKGVFTEEEFRQALDREAALLDKDYEQQFPGWESTPHGMAIVDVPKAHSYMKNWRP